MRNKKKKPVLTSPWKIGMFVSLLLSVVSFGVGYYLVNVYNINLVWLQGNASEWIVDSIRFFKEIYPLASGVIIISLATYFIIASAVRRYKFYLDSGQDYRKMISLADSIDDLTNPAQIARLSDYPELQNILRNYGDQIREISDEMGHKEDELRSVDMEMEIDSLLAGNALQETLVEGKWWASAVRKVGKYISERNRQVEGVKQQEMSFRKISSQAALAYGRVMESVGGASEDLLEIVRAVGELNSLGKQLGGESPGAVSDAGRRGGDTVDAMVVEMEKSLEMLKDGSRTLLGFSEENNGLALNIALMAAKGNVDDRDLAKFAEKVRSSAERFNQLGSAVTQIVRSFTNKFEMLKGGARSAGGAALDSGAQKAVKEISDRIEKSSHRLQEKITTLGNELDDINRSFHEALSGQVSEGIREETEVRDRGSIVNFGSDSVEEKIESNLVIDHGKVWEESDSFEVSYAAESEKEEGSGDSLEAKDEMLFGDFTVDSGSTGKEIPDDKISLDQPLPGIPAAATPPQAPPVAKDSPVGPAAREPEADEDWAEMPGHRWIKTGAERERP
ncbi:MAG: methyl-accepting chemotaxis protein, partial [Candidatus Krumholzibacteriota bacterium]|nr:methyl-accepting chemotaxis protein [Candidatus Krumholzibacteriota bacterium]